MSQKDLLLDRNSSVRVELQLQSSVSAMDREHISKPDATAVSLCEISAPVYCLSMCACFVTKCLTSCVQLDVLWSFPSDIVTFWSNLSKESSSLCRLTNSFTLLSPCHFFMQASSVNSCASDRISSLRKWISAAPPEYYGPPGCFKGRALHQHAAWTLHKC